MEINVPKSIFSGPNRFGQQRKKKHVLEMLLEKEGNANHLYNFKIQPSIVGTVGTPPARPIPEFCKHCLTESHMMVDANVQYLGLEDNFLPSTLSCHNSRFTRMFPFYAHYRRNCAFAQLYKLPTWKQLEEDADLLSLYPEEMFDNSCSFVETRKNVLDVLRQMEIKSFWASILRRLIGFSAWVCQKYFGRKFESVLVHEAQIEILRCIQATTLPVVYVPTYRSNLDKTLILWTLAHHAIRTPLFLSSHANKCSLEKLFGKFGASLKVKPDYKGGELKYSSAFSVYFRHLLRNGNSLMFNLESKRSRTGRPSSSIYGTEILKLIYDEYMNQKVEDVYFVPVSVSYESLPELEELVLKNSEEMGVIYLLKSAFRFIYACVNPSPQGIAKISFGQPFCLREFDRAMKRNLKVKILSEGQTESYGRSRDCSFLRWDSSESVNSVSSLYGELSPLYPPEDQQDQAVILDVLNYHLMYDASRSESLMPTHLLSFLLTKKFRQGVELEKLKTEVEWIINIMKSQKRDFGFSILECDSESIILRAVELLGNDVCCEYSKEDKMYNIKPNLQIDSLKKLDYYANYILPDFMMKGIIATVVFFMCGTQLTVLQGFDAGLQMRDEEFIYHCRRVYEIFTGGYFLHSPCLTADTAIRLQVAELCDTGVMSLIMKERKSYHWEDQSDDEYFDECDEKQYQTTDHNVAVIPDEVKVIASNSTFEILDFYRKLLIPYIEVYAFLASTLKVLLNVDGPPKEMKMTELQKYMLEKLEERSPDFQCPELLNMQTVKSFLVSCEDHNILFPRTKSQSFVRFYELAENYSFHEKLDTLTNDIMQYVTK